MTWKADCPYCDSTLEGETETHAAQVRVDHLWDDCAKNRTKDWYERITEPYQ